MIIVAILGSGIKGKCDDDKGGSSVKKCKAINTLRNTFIIFLLKHTKYFFFCVYANDFLWCMITIKSVLFMQV